MNGPKSNVDSYTFKLGKSQNDVRMVDDTRKGKMRYRLTLTQKSVSLCLLIRWFNRRVNVRIEFSASDNPVCHFATKSEEMWFPCYSDLSWNYTVEAELRSQQMSSDSSSDSDPGLEKSTPTPAPTLLRLRPKRTVPF